MDGAGEVTRRGPARPRIAAGYRPLAGIHDEMVDAEGRVRPAWTRFLAAADRLGRDELERRFAVAERSLRDSGVFYRVYDETGGGGERPWPLAPVPLIIAAEEWRELCAGLVERAALLERLLADAYGPRRLLAEGALPAAAIAGSPEYLRPLAGVEPAGGSFLRLIAVDLGRAPNGKWWVLGDRTQAPSGAGYALENRVALARALPELYAEMSVERLAGFFQSFRSALTAGVPREDPRIGVLTPGSFNETYFEHAYLARYLGFLLVEGGDLTVREQAVYIRTVAGLRRVDVLWRRLDADFADPLELNPQSRLGVAGLVGAVRSGSVVLANPLGSGLVESRAMMSFVPALGRRLLGRDLRLPNIATWWCGQDAERAAVVADLARLAVAPAFGATLPEVLDDGTALAADLSPRARARLVEAIQRRGADIVGQEVVKLSTMPVWHEGRLQPRPFILRVFLAATEDGWKVMPGGFCRISERVDARAVTMQAGGTSADVWVAGDGPVQPVTLLTPPERTSVRRATGVLPSRVADNLFWLGRYLERLEGTARAVRGVAGRLDYVDTPEAPILTHLVGLLASTGAGPSAAAAAAKRTPIELAAAALADTELPASVASLAESARRTASVIRDRLSPDAWRALTGLRAEIAVPATPTGGDCYDVASTVLRTLAAFAGLEQENMNRLTGWQFLELGRRIERGLSTCRYARAFGFDAAPAGALDVLLELCDSQITYRTRYVAGLARLPVLDLVLLDPNNPRSLAFQAARIEEHLERLPPGDTETVMSAPMRIAARLSTRLRTSEAETLDIETTDGVADTLLTLSDDISIRYFTHRGVPTIAPEELG